MCLGFRFGHCLCNICKGFVLSSDRYWSHRGCSARDLDFMAEVGDSLVARGSDHAGCCFGKGVVLILDKEKNVVHWLMHE